MMVKLIGVLAYMPGSVMNLVKHRHHVRSTPFHVYTHTPTLLGGNDGTEDSVPFRGNQSVTLHFCRCVAIHPRPPAVD